MRYTMQKRPVHQDISNIFSPSDRHQHTRDLTVIKPSEVVSYGFITQNRQFANKEAADVEYSIKSSQSARWILLSTFLKMKASKLSYPNELKHTYVS